VYFPDFDGCQTYDDTLEGAELMAKDVLEGFIEVLLEMGNPLPEPSNIKNVSAINGMVMMMAASASLFPAFTEISKGGVSVVFLYVANSAMYTHFIKSINLSLLVINSAKRVLGNRVFSKCIDIF
jgi:predicted RNase H-like HicB family nuclease